MPTKYRHLIDACSTVEQLLDLQHLVYLAGLGNSQTGDGDADKAERNTELCWFAWHLGRRTAEVSRRNG